MTASLLIRGARVLELDGELDNPPARDVLVVDGAIHSVAERIAPPPGAKVVEASGCLMMPGLVNAHYHSHDVLARGMFERLPLESWGTLAGPLGSKRPLAEVRARTLAGAVECLRNGITTVQDMCSFSPMDEAVLDTILDAYAEAGLRVVFGVTVRDLSQLDTIPWIADLAPRDLHDIIGTASDAPGPQVDYVSAQIRRLGTRGGMLRWALAPSAPQRCSPGLLEAVADLAKRHSLPVYTHVYETRTQRVFAQERLAAFGGSAVRMLQATGLLGPHVTLAHSVWPDEAELDLIGSTGTNVVLNMLSNLKLKSVVAPILEYRGRGVNMALGCDNCSCSDTQNLLQVMKLFCLLAGVSTPERDTPTAADALRAATLGGAKTAGMAGQVGAIRAGQRADLVLLDLADPAYVPYNSAIRQLVYAESGRSIRTVIVDGRVVVDQGRATGVDEAALREEIAGLMPRVRDDVTRLNAGYLKVQPYLDEVQRRAFASPLHYSRLVGTPQRG